MVSRSFSSHPIREWIVFYGLLRVFKNKLYVPVVNLSDQPPKWEKSTELAYVERLSGPVTIVNPDINIVATDNKLSPLPTIFQENLVIGNNLV